MAVNAVSSTLSLRAALQHLPQGVDLPEAEQLLLHIVQKNTAFLRTWPDHLLTPSQADALAAGLARLGNGEPLAYVLGEQAFWTLLLTVTPDTLIPRPDTERLVEVALGKLAQIAASAKILDLGTGSGAIALALAKECPQAQVTATDFSAAALAVAQHNAQKNSLSNCEFQQGSWFDAIKKDQKFELIVSNPPYIDPLDQHLAALTHEPISALTAPEHGLADLRQIIQNAPDHLQPNGWLILEHGYDQGLAVRQLLAARGFVVVQTVQDYGGNERVSLGQWCASCQKSRW